MAGHTWVGRGVSTPGARYAQDLVFETADGFITAGAVSDAEWKGLCRAIDRPDWLRDERFATPAGRVANAGERLTMLQDVLRTATSAIWLERLEAEDVPCAPVLDRKGLLSHPQILENGLVVESEHPIGGTIRQARPAERFDKPARCPRIVSRKLARRRIAPIPSSPLRPPTAEDDRESDRRRPLPDETKLLSICGSPE
jgi:crotonobetainyl-CoA:carnitine CoA-transferase CaiB-like acyl-CoA transferase